MFEKVLYVISQLKCRTNAAVLRSRLYIMMVESKFVAAVITNTCLVGIVVKRNINTPIIQVAAAVYVTMDLIIDNIRSKQEGGVVKRLERWTSSPEFKSRPDRQLDLFLVVLHDFKFSITLVTSQMVCLRPVEVLNPVMFIWIICCSFVFGPTSFRAVNIAQGKSSL